MVSEAGQATFTERFFDYWFSLPYGGPVIWYELIDGKLHDSDRGMRLAHYIAVKHGLRNPLIKSFYQR